MRKDDPPIIVEERFDCPLREVWAAITEVDQMQQWFFSQIPSFVPQIGFETEFIVQVEDRSFTHLWRISELELFSKIKYQWSYKEYIGDSTLSFELTEEKSQTRLKVSAEVLEDFPDDIPEFTRESAIAGWNYLIKESLKGYLA